MSDGSFATWLTSPAPPVWLAFIGLAVLAIRFFPSWKQRWTEARTADDAIVGNQWTRLTSEIKRLDHRVRSLEESEEKCRAELADAKNRIAELEGYNMGRGEARNEAQRIVSAEREADARKRDKGNG